MFWFLGLYKLLIQKKKMLWEKKLVSDVQVNLKVPYPFVVLEWWFQCIGTGYILTFRIEQHNGLEIMPCIIA